MPRWGAYVPEEEYQSHIANHVDKVEVHVSHSMRSSPEISAYKHLNRLIHVNRNTMLLFAQVPVRRLVMPSQVPLW